MAQGYRCDWPDHDAPADVLMTALGTGNTDAYCGAHFIETMRGAIALMDQSEAEAAATDAAAIAALEAPPPKMAKGRKGGEAWDEPTGESIPGEAPPEPAADAEPVAGEGEP